MPPRDRDLVFENLCLVASLASTVWGGVTALALATWWVSHEPVLVLCRALVGDP